MIYLNKGFFKPMFILISTIILPVLIALLATNIKSFQFSSFFILGVLILGYLLLVLKIYQYSMSKRNYLIVKEQTLLMIKYPNISANDDFLSLNLVDIIKIEYYRMSSIKSWGMLYNYVCPRCAYITYLYQGNLMVRHLGYPLLSDIRDLCKNFNITLIVY